MNLTTQLQNLQTQFQNQTSENIQETMGQAIADLKKAGILEQTLKVGDRIPQFALPDASGDRFDLQTALAKGPVVISFYRGGWCPYCSLELKALQQALPQIEAAGANLIAVSPETPDHALSTQEKQELSFTVLSDIGNNIARQFGIVFQLPAALRPIYQSFGIDIPAHNSDQSFELPVPATYVVAPNRKIIYAFADIDYTKRAEPDDVVAALKQIT